MSRLNHFGRALRLLRDVRGLSQVEVAKRAGISASMLSHYERSEKLPSLKTLGRLADALDLYLGELDDALDAAAGRPATGRRSARPPADPRAEVHWLLGVTEPMPEGMEKGFAEILSGFREIARTLVDGWKAREG